MTAGTRDGQALEGTSCLLLFSGRSVTRIRRGSTVTKAPEPSADSWARSAATTASPMDAGLVSSQRTCTTLGPVAPVAASNAAKSRSCVKTTQPDSLAHRMISQSGAVGFPTSVQWMASHPDPASTRPHSGERFMSIKTLTGPRSLAVPAPRHAMNHKPTLPKGPHPQGKDTAAGSPHGLPRRQSSPESCPR